MGRKRNIHIEHPEVWELLVAMGDRRLDYILYTPTVANSLIIGEKELTDDSLLALEDAVYDIPELLGDYKRVRVTVQSRSFVLFNNDATDDDCLALVRQAFPDDVSDAAVCAVPGNGVKIAWLMPHGMQAFLGRTFNYPIVCHHLAPLCGHFADLNADAEPTRMYIYLEDGNMDLAVYRDGKLMCANAFPFSNHQDAVYFALNAWRSCGLDQLTDELQLMGDRELCAAMTPELRAFVKSVMPAVYPAAAMRLGRNAIQAPFELILLALCE